jgi:hypothetical protein
MNGAGDKMVTNGNADSNNRSRKGGKAGPIATVKFGSSSVPIYLSESNGRKRYFIAHYRDGKRIRKAFPDLPAAKKEAQFVAQRIQSGMQHVTDMKPQPTNSRSYYTGRILRLRRLANVRIVHEISIVDEGSGMAETNSIPALKPPDPLLLHEIPPSWLYDVNAGKIQLLPLGSENPFCCCVTLRK